jgi:hypothetical protein
LPLARYLNDNKLAYWRVPSLEIKRSRGISRGKDDKIDSKDIAFYSYTHLHKFREGSISSKSVQQLRLLFTEREKILKSLTAFEKTSENKDFVSKDIFNVVTSVNRSVVNKLKQALKSIEKKMLDIIAKDAELNQKYFYPRNRNANGYLPYNNHQRL